MRDAGSTRVFTAIMSTCPGSNEHRSRSEGPPELCCVRMAVIKANVGEPASIEDGDKCTHVRPCRAARRLVTLTGPGYSLRSLIGGQTGKGTARGGLSSRWLKESRARRAATHGPQQRRYRQQQKPPSHESHSKLYSH